MTLNQSALLELTEVLRSADGGELIRRLALTMLQALVDAEATARIGAGPHERTDTRITQRNGTREKVVSTTAGDLTVKIPKTRTAQVGQEWGVRAVSPTALAEGVQGLDFDRARRPDALVGWSLDQTAAAWDATHRHTNTGGDDNTAVTADWATQLDPTSSVDRAAAAEAVGRYGPDVDATLAGTYPGLLTAATDAQTAANTGEGSALAQQERERAEALTAESTARTLRGDDVVGGLGGDEDIDREEAAVTQDADAAEHRGRQSGAHGQVEQARDEKVTAQFTPTRAATATAPRRGSPRTSPTTPTPTQTRARGRSR